MIESIFRLGDDALQNQFELNITPLSFLPDVDPLKLRTTECNIPEWAIGTYTVDYKTQRFEKPNGKIETPMDFQFTFRSDKYWTIYQALMVWKNYIGDDRNGAMAEDVGAISGESNFRTDVSVLTIDSNGVPTSPGWHFHQCWLKRLDGVSFSQQSGDPITVGVTFSFLKVTPH